VASVISANKAPPRCPQGTKAPFQSHDWQCDEDCLFLNVYAPEDAQDLPVLVWIHGGGYGEGDGNQFPTSIIHRSGRKIVGVAIQYRLGAFGFLASEDVRNNGTLNAGLHDQQFALRWVQKYIHLFGGNASRITIGGHSAGGGSALLQAIAYGGNVSPALFSNIIAASPYLPSMYTYNDTVPSYWYKTFAETAGCGGFQAARHQTFECLQNTSSRVLLLANAVLSASGPYGSWAFVPVIDGAFMRSPPGQQLQAGGVLGHRVLSGNVANEAVSFVPQNISSENDLRSWLQLNYPSFMKDQVSSLLRYYPMNDDHALLVNNGRYSTDGTTGASALTTSAFATGYQQMANNIYAEATFVCPSYWLVDAFSSEHSSPDLDGRMGYKYQYSAAAAQHGADLDAIYGSSEDRGLGPDLSNAFRLSWANFIMHNNPSISIRYANGRALGIGDTGGERLSKWPAWKKSGVREMVNWNQTGGEQFRTWVVEGAPEVLLSRGKWLRNRLNVYDAVDWEGGRGERCELWRNLTSKLPD
jgi:carboxylesterase type B